MTYRWRGHVGPYDDLDKGLRSKEELDCWMKKCPIKRLGRQLLKQGTMTRSEMDQTRRRISEEVEEAVDFARESSSPDESDLLRDVFR
jgi:pyruvate dehydrogenase E1 component alpha subunit